MSAWTHKTAVRALRFCFVALTRVSPGVYTRARRERSGGRGLQWVFYPKQTSTRAQYLPKHTSYFATDLLLHSNPTTHPCSLPSIIQNSQRTPATTSKNTQTRCVALQCPRQPFYTHTSPAGHSTHLTHHLTIFLCARAPFYLAVVQIGGRAGVCGGREPERAGGDKSGGAEEGGRA